MNLIWRGSLIWQTLALKYRRRLRRQLKAVLRGRRLEAGSRIDRGVQFSPCLVKATAIPCSPFDKKDHLPGPFFRFADANCLTRISAVPLLQSLGKDGGCRSRTDGQYLGVDVGCDRGSLPGPSLLLQSSHASSPVDRRLVSRGILAGNPGLSNDRHVQHHHWYGQTQLAGTQRQPADNS